MTNHAPPRLAMSLLGRCFPHDDPLTGDLIEEFATGRSRTWFWRQVLTAAGCRGPLRVRLAGLGALVLLVGPVIGYVGYARALSEDTALPRLVQRLTIEEMGRSVLTDGHASVRLDGPLVDVTGVLERVTQETGVDQKAIPALYVTTSFQVPRFGAVFLLDPSVDAGVLTPGERVTLRCPVLDSRVSQSLCVVVPE